MANIKNPYSVKQSVLSTSDKKIRYDIHLSVKQALFDIKKNQFNTVISYCMKILISLNNTNHVDLISETLNILIRMIAPFTPHISQALWTNLKFGDNIFDADYPQFDASAIVPLTIEIVVQINGKKKGLINVSSNSTEAEIKKIAQRFKRKFCSI